MSSDSVYKCIHVLKSAQSDNERFAALMTVTKLVRAAELDTESRRGILDALGINFLTRLLKTKSVPEGCPGNIYKSLALSILASFCQDPVVVSDPEVKKQVTVFNEIILGETCDEDLPMLSDCYDCLQGMLLSPASRVSLIEGGAVPALVEVIVTGTTGCDRASKVLLDLCLVQPERIWERQPRDVHKLMRHLVTQFQQKKDATKFDVAETIILVLSTLNKEKSEDRMSWVTDLVHEMDGIIRSKLAGYMRETALCLVSSIISSQGVTCFLPPAAEDAKLLLLVIHLACIDIRMTLEDGREEHIKSRAGVVSSCYGLLENIIHHLTTAPSLCLDDKQVAQLHSAMLGAFNSIIFFLSNVEQKTLDFPRTSLLVVASVRVLGAWLAEETSALKEEVYKLLPFLVQMCNLNEESEADVPTASFNKLSMMVNRRAELEEDCDTVNERSDNFISGMPVTAAECELLSKELSCRNKDTHEPETLPRVKTDQSSSEENGTGLQMTLVDETQSSSNSMNPTPAVDLTKFLLPAFCHLTAEDKPRTILLEECLHVLLLNYFQKQMGNFLGTKNEEVKDSLGSICGIFLNLTVTEPELVRTHHVFHELLILVFKYLPLTVHDPATLILTANFTTIGLMLLRQQIHRTDLSIDKRDQFLAGSISFLSKAHSCRKRGKLSISESYTKIWEDISELWFLSLQGLCALVPVLTDLVKLIMKSGWIPALIRMLLDAKGQGVDADVQSSYLGLLVILATQNRAAKEIILEKQGIELAHLYHSEDLLKLLAVS